MDSSYSAIMAEVKTFGVLLLLFLGTAHGNCKFIGYTFCVKNYLDPPSTCKMKRQKDHERERGKRRVKRRGKREETR